ncbi:MAG: DUF2157 domain-containing protein [bacterium]
MDKQQIIALIEGQLATGKISKVDLLSIVNDGAPIPQPVFHSEPVSGNPLAEEEHSKNLINTFYAIGAIIAIIGVIILIVQHWTEIGFFGRILVTLGISLITYLCALILDKPDQKKLSQVMFIVSAVLAPIGSVILLNEAKITFDWNIQILTALILATVYGTALFISKKSILMLVAIGFASWAYYASIMKIFSIGMYGSGPNILKWASMLLGVSYILIAYGYNSVTHSDEDDMADKKAIQNVLYGFGTLAILGAGILVGGSFDLFFILMIFAAFYGSVYLKSQTMLTLGAIFLMAHIIKLTSRYFIGSVGWPVALIVVGFLIIGVGYTTLYLNKKFIS